MKHAKELVQKVGRGQGGFTLIELLVVIVILGVIAAVVVLNVGGFMGRGTEEAANTEAHQVQTAVIAYMADNNLTDFDGTITPSSALGPEDFLMNPAQLQADYTVTDGALTGASPISGSKWASCTFTDGQWTCP